MSKEKHPIPIDDNWAIKTDPLCVILCKPHFNKKKQTKEWTNFGYYNNFSHALQVLIDRDVQGNQFETLKEIVQRIEQLQEMIVEALGPSSPIRDLYHKPPVRKGII